MSHYRLLGDSGVLLSIPEELDLVWSRVLLKANSASVSFEVFVEKFPAKVSWLAIVISLAFRADVRQRQALGSKWPFGRWAAGESVVAVNVSGAGLSFHSTNTGIGFCVADT